MVVSLLQDSAREALRSDAGARVLELMDMLFCEVSDVPLTGEKSAAVAVSVTVAPTRQRALPDELRREAARLFRQFRALRRVASP